MLRVQIFDGKNLAGKNYLNLFRRKNQVEIVWKFLLYRYKICTIVTKKNKCATTFEISLTKKLLLDMALNI
jgi:hypothetical protein